MIRVLLCLAAAVSLGAQPRVGLIDYYGVHKVGTDRLQRALGVKPGDVIPPSKVDLEAKVEGLSGVLRSHVEASCCVDGKAMLYVGIEERNTPHFSHRLPEEPKMDPLPEEAHNLYNEFMDCAAVAARMNDTEEDLSSGQSMMRNIRCRAIQIRIADYANKSLGLLRQAVREAPDEDRAIAAYLIGYVETKRIATDDLQWALQDADASVRANALRALTPIAYRAMRDPDGDWRVEPTWMVEMLNSVVWSDRMNAVRSLLTLTDGRDARLLALIRDRAKESLAECARWQHLPHALPFYFLLGRVGGLSEAEIQKTWSEGQREATITKILKAKPKSE
jgi:hypothetical protein